VRLSVHALWLTVPPRTSSSTRAAGPHDHDERDLVERLHHEPAAFVDLYEAHRGPIYQFALRRLRNPADAEDVTSETFLRALRSMGSYRYTGAPLRAWLVRIATSAIADHRRRTRHRSDDLNQHPEVPASESIEDMAAARDQVRRIAAVARERLSEGQRAALLLRFEEDLSHREIGHRLGRSHLASKLLLHRAMKALRAAIDEQPPWN
jgi:RNA polymerase sigma-70 factor, ECF subfamily